MSVYDTIPRRRFYRNREKALLGGVCAGVADYFGFNLRVTRVLAFIGFLMAMPMAFLIYFGTVLLVPPGPDPAIQDGYDPEFRKAVRAAPAEALSDVRRRFQSLDSRLARLERYVTSARFKLDQEFRKL